MQLLVTVISGFIKVWRYWQVLLILVVVQLFAAWLISVPMGETMQEQWDYSLIGEQLSESGILQSTVYEEFIIGNAGQMQNIYNKEIMIVYGVLLAIFSVFVLAGALPLYCGLDLKFHWDRLWSDSARFFKAFLGLSIISAIFLWLVHLLSNTINDLVANAIVNNNDELTVFITGTLFTNGLRFLLFSLIVMVFQYAKIASASEQLRNLIYLVTRAFSFVGRHFLKVLILFVMINILDIGMNLLDHAVWHYWIADSDIIVQWIWIIFVTIVLVSIKLSYFSSQLILYVETRRKESETGGVRISGGSGGYSSDY